MNSISRNETNDIIHKIFITFTSSIIKIMLNTFKHSSFQKTTRNYGGNLIIHFTNFTSPFSQQLNSEISVSEFLSDHSDFSAFFNSLI